MSDTPDLLVSLDGGIGRVILNRPQVRNAISQAMWEALPDACARLAGARVVVISGAGGAFSAGADIAEFDTVYADESSIRAANDTVRAAQQALADLPCPVIAQIDGVCVGGGCGLALHADLRFASDRSRFAITPARLGLAYSFEDTARLVRTVGLSAAKDILFSARLLGADEALKIRLVDRVFPAEALASAVDEYADGLSALSAESLAIAKATINAAASGTEPDEALRTRFDASFASADFHEGSAAFREKRKPRFR